jgi:hypothetical protein
LRSSYDRTNRVIISALASVLGLKAAPFVRLNLISRKKPNNTAGIRKRQARKIAHLKKNQRRRWEDFYDS